MKEGPRGIELSRKVKSDLALAQARLEAIFSDLKSPALQAAAKVVFSGGKRLRPMLTLICGQDAQDHQWLIEVATAIELIHTASLIHDDAIDRAVIRRGAETVNHLFGEEAAIAAGDYIFGLSFVIIASYADPKVLGELSLAALSLSEGEIGQTKSLFNTASTIEEYLEKSKRKTASLFGAACSVGALIAGRSEREAALVKKFGESIGLAFQIYDDILDITADQSELGKPVGIDIKEGVVTLPIIYAIEESKEREDLQRVIKDVNSSDDDVAWAIKTVKATSAIARAKALASSFINDGHVALSALKDDESKRSLISIANFVGDRHF